MSQQYALSAFQHDQVYARVVRVGRWTWRIRVLVPVTGDGLGHATFVTPCTCSAGDERNEWRYGWSNGMSVSTPGG